MELSTWDLVSLIAKLSWYLGVIAAAGGTLSVWLLADHSRRSLRWGAFYSLAGALLGFHGVILYFLTQVGAANDSGLAGMLDWGMITFFLDLGVGEASLLRMGVLLLLIVGQVVTLAHLGRLSSPPGQGFFQLFFRLNAAALFILLLSFQATGHITPLSLTARLALVLHVLCVVLWLGSLVPLWRSTRLFEPEQVQVIMYRFSSRASVLVAVLLLAALLLVVQLFDSPAQLTSSVYGLVLMLKAALVMLMLALAALNRWWLVPMLGKPGGLFLLRRSLTLEVAAGLLVLATTVFLSTVVGPPSHG